ncbi:hypothetical protein GUJ93_ZPchr0006g45706 [Zizania palustris]|uniref:Uncharacterized protein n=1 Tax=Zizania palustris TaxID=103762 RepID=A0A8J5T8S7_ZIZPA|nr:hypothetical protein GUJ93_ZPchr0006g45706 [Zizania palustris]
MPWPRPSHLAPPVPRRLASRAPPPCLPTRLPRPSPAAPAPAPRPPRHPRPRRLDCAPTAFNVRWRGSAEADARGGEAAGDRDARRRALRPGRGLRGRREMGGGAAWTRPGCVWRGAADVAAWFNCW